MKAKNPKNSVVLDVGISILKRLLDRAPATPMTIPNVIPSIIHCRLIPIPTGSQTFSLSKLGHQSIGPPSITVGWSIPTEEAPSNAPPRKEKENLCCVLFSILRTSSEDSSRLSKGRSLSPDFRNCRNASLNSSSPSPDSLTQPSTPRLYSVESLYESSS